MLKIEKQIYYTATAESLKVYPGLNTAKAVLIMLVVFAHCLPAGMIQYYNYFFEMPLFMAISGFLLKTSAFKNGLNSYLIKMTKRLIVPWLFAMIVYFPLQLNGRSLMQFSVFDLLYPFYHLWFIPAYLLSAIICYAITKHKVPVLLVLVLSGIGTGLWYVLFRDTPELTTDQILYYFGDKRLYAYIFFFVAGFGLRNQFVSIRPLPIPLLFIITSSFILVAICVENSFSSWFTVLPYLFFNFSLLVYVLHYWAPQNIIRSKFLDFVNKHSLGIYLYHPIIMIGIYKLIGDPAKQFISMPQGFIVGAITLAIVVPVVWLVSRSKYSDKLMLGNTK